MKTLFALQIDETRQLRILAPWWLLVVIVLVALTHYVVIGVIAIAVVLILHGAWRQIPPFAVPLRPWWFIQTRGMSKADRDIQLSGVRL
ncbi:MAG: hypothetical protein AAF802_08450 [Planctomycetota bacterium]